MKDHLPQRADLGVNVKGHLCSRRRALRDLTCARNANTARYVAPDVREDACPSWVNDVNLTSITQNREDSA